VLHNVGKWVNALVFITLIFNLERVASLHFVAEWEDMAGHISVFKKGQ